MYFHIQIVKNRSETHIITLQLNHEINQSFCQYYKQKTFNTLNQSINQSINAISIINQQITQHSQINQQNQRNQSTQLNQSTDQPINTIRSINNQSMQSVRLDNYMVELHSHQQAVFEFILSVSLVPTWDSLLHSDKHPLQLCRNYLSRPRQIF